MHQVLNYISKFYMPLPLRVLCCVHYTTKSKPIIFSFLVAVGDEHDSGHTIPKCISRFSYFLSLCWIMASSSDKHSISLRFPSQMPNATNSFPWTPFPFSTQLSTQSKASLQLVPNLIHVNISLFTRFLFLHFPYKLLYVIQLVLPFPHEVHALPNVTTRQS